MQFPIINLIGPTACGKSDIAISLAKQLPISIISVDSTLIYRGMDIGTAKPAAELRAAIPHYLIDICEPNTCYSAGHFATATSELIPQIQQQQRIPLLVGGTMLYFKALYQGLANLPTANPIVRQYVENLALSLGWEHCHSLLKKLDPQSGERIHPHDPQRIQRALEVYYLTGKPLSQHWQNNKLLLPPNIRYFTIGLYPHNRQQLHQRIEQRFDEMLDQGFIEEVKVLFQNPELHSDLPSMRAVGYRQIWQYLNGEIDFKTMRLNAMTATRQLAKRQLTWLKTWPNVDYWIDPFVETQIADDIIAKFQLASFVSS